MDNEIREKLGELSATINSLKPLTKDIKDILERVTRLEAKMDNIKDLNTRMLQLEEKMATIENKMHTMEGEMKGAQSTRESFWTRIGIVVGWLITGIGWLITLAEKWIP